MDPSIGKKTDSRPHSRACGWRPHEHGSLCHSNCPTCGGKDGPARRTDATDSPDNASTSETEFPPVAGHDNSAWEPWSSVDYTGDDGYGHQDTVRISVLGSFVFLGILDGLGSARLDSASMRELGELLIEGAEVIERRMATNVSEPSTYDN